MQYSPDAGLTLVLPRNASLAEGEAFLRDRHAWITACHDADDTGLDRPRTPPAIPTEIALLAIDGRLTVPTGEGVLTVQQRVRDRAAAVLPDWVSEMSAETGLPYARVRIGNQRSRWGSYSSRQTLSLNWRLMLLPPGMVDYVVLHELAHSKVMNHSTAFWQLLESICPDARGQDARFDAAAAQILPAWARYWPA